MGMNDWIRTENGIVRCNDVVAAWWVQTSPKDQEEKTGYLKVRLRTKNPNEIAYIATYDEAQSFFENLSTTEALRRLRRFVESRVGGDQG